jgi:hypothetical protein
MTPGPGLIQRAILTPLAASRGLDYEMEFMAPGSSEAAQAYGFVSCGAELLLGLTYAEGFPSKDKRTTKRGVKWLVEGAPGDGAQTAAVLLSQAMALSLEITTRRSGNEESANLQRGFRELIQRVYPLNDRDLGRLESLSTYHRIMETHDVPDEARALLPTGYVWALVDPSHEAHADPDADENLVETHTTFADGYLRSMANLYAIELVVGEKRYAELEPKLLMPASMDYERLVQQQAELVQWVSVAEQWHKHGERTLAADPEPEPLDDEIADYLRRRTSTMLLQPKEPVGKEAGQAIQDYAYGTTNSEPDWNLLTDAELIGYWLRRSEEELNDHRVISRKALDAFMQHMDADSKGPLFAAAVWTKHENLPGLFSRDEDSWKALRSWAQDRALSNSAGRRSMGMEQDEPTQTSVQGTGIAFDFGYVLRAVETTMYGEDE